MKICTTCHQSKSLSSFHKSKRANDGHQYVCKDCTILCSRAWYQQNRTAKLAKMNRQMTVERRWFRAFKTTQVCLHCGFNNPAALVFHHRDPAMKSFVVSTAIARHRTRKTILAEMAKCDVLCSNCHLIFHDSQRHRGTINA